MTDGNSLLSEDLIQQVQDIARDQNREPRELVQCPINN
jgi:hypothetical protein